MYGLRIVMIQDYRKLKQECKAEVTSIPMVRATTIDNTERLEGPFDLVWQQGQNIGISESSYRKLKKAVGEKPKKHLNLDKNGKKIYVVSARSGNKGETN